MTRRITAALLALMLLFTSFPVFAAAEETTVHTKGQTICIDWKLGIDPNDAKSTYPVQVGYMWQIQRDENGQMVSVCTLPEHKHLKSCFQGSTRICGIDPHTHDELGACSDSMGWVWEVIRDPNYTGWDYDPEAPENYEFSVCAIDPDGVHPMVGVGFALTRPATEEEKAATGNDKVSVLENSQSLLTNKRGYAYFDGTCSTAEPAGDATWTLVQNTGKFAPGGEYHETYRPHTVKWEVDVTVNGDGTYTVKDIRDPEDDGVSAAADYVIPLPEQGYNKELRRLVMLHDLVRVKLYIDGRFVPQGFESFDVTITGDSGFLENFTMVNGEQGWHYVREDLAPDTYHVKVNMNGYPITYKMGYPNQELTESETGLLLNADHSNGLVEIHFGVLSNTIRMNSMYAGEDTSINGNIRYGLYLEGEDTPVEEFGPTDLESVVRIGGDDWHVLWDNYGTEGGTLRFTLKQSQVPEYHTISAEEYTVTITQAAETAEEPYIVQLKKAAGEEEVRYGTDNEQIATFRNQRPDLSHCVTAKTYDDAETPNLIPGGEFALYENDEMIPVEDPSDIDFSVYAGSEKREFILVQEAAPAGYAQAEEEYKITVTMDEDKPVVKVAKNEGVLARIATFFSGERIEQDEFGRWIVTFTSRQTEPVVKIINTVEIYSVDENRVGFADDEVRYGLYRDTYENGEKPAVEFPNETITRDAAGVIRVTSDDWMNIALANQTLASAADIAKLMEGGSIDITLKQSNPSKGYTDAQEEYTLTLSKATDDSEDMFSVVLTAAKGDEPVRYGENGEQQAFFVHETIPMKISNTVEIYSVDENRSPVTDAEVRYGLYRDTYENGEKPAVEFPSETIVQSDGVIRITSDDWMNIAMANQNLASAADIAKLMDGGSIDITLKQSNSSKFYADAQEEYTLTLSKAADDSEDMFSVVLTAAKGNETVCYGENGEQQVYFVHATIPMKISNTVEIYSVDENRSPVTDTEVRYGLYRDTYENGEKPAVEFPTDTIVQENGVIRITSDDWMNIAMANQNLASAADLMALRNGESIDITLKQSNAPKAYGDAVEEYTLTLSRAAADSEDLFSVVLSTSKGDEAVRYGANGEQQVYFVHAKKDVQEDLSHIVTIKTYDDAEGTNDLSNAGAVYALYENNAEIKTLTSNEIDFSTFEAVDKEYVLKQKAAPAGYKTAAEQYKISLTWTDGKPVVTVAKDQNVLQRIAQLFSGDGVEQDASGRWITIFVSEKIVDTTVATARIQLTLEEIQKVWNKNTVKDSALESEINEMEYAFVLYWKENETAGWQKHSKQLVLSSGTRTKTGTFDIDIPVGTAYKVVPADADALYAVTFSVSGKTSTDILEGTVSKENTTANDGIISVSATPRFEFTAGTTAASLTLYKVNARDLSKPLSGAKFTLKDENGIVLKDYNTQKDGAITIYANTLNGSSSYTLKETIAPDGYVLLKKAVEITMEYQYERAEENGKVVAKQNTAISPTLTDDVVQGSDGTYYIKNVYESDLPQTGDAFDPVLWIGLLTASAAAMAVLLISNKRRNSVR